MTLIKGKWKLAVDLLDLDLGKPFYQSSNVTISPSIGLRAMWMRQNVKVTLTEEPGSVDNPPPQPIYSRNHSGSWAVGPRMGFDANLLFTSGFRLEGNLAASLLFTQYTSIYHSEDRADIFATPPTLRVSMNNYNALRPILETGLGFGWGRYLCCQKYHIDFKASYDFSYYFHQNVLRMMMDEFVDNVSCTAGNLMMQGLTLSAQFDF